MKVQVIVIKDGEHKYTAICRALPGVCVSADSHQEVLKKLDEAIRDYLASLGVPFRPSPNELVLHLKFRRIPAEDEEVVSEEIAGLVRDINAYHVASGGNGLTVVEWESLAEVAVPQRASAYV